MTPLRRVSLLLTLPLLLFALALPSGCGKVDESTIELWSGSEAGIEKMGAFIADPNNERGLRMRALELLVQGGFARNARTLLEKAPDRDDLAPALVERLLPTLGQGDLDAQVAAKDALILVLVLVPEAQQDAIKKAIADWAFAGLADDATGDQVREHVEARIRLGQIPDLGPHGAEGALRLLSHGFGLERLYTYLTEMKDPAINLRVLRAFEALHKTPDIDIPPHHMEKVQALDIPEAAVYLLRLYMRDDLPRDIRGDAFGLAIRAFQSPELESAGPQLLPELYKILAAGENDDRRLAAHYILRFGGVAELSRVLAAFQDDGSFSATIYETARFTRDICRDDVIKLRGDPVPALVETLGKDSRIGKLLALVCLKLSQRVDALAKLETLLADETAMGDLLGEERTLGQLAQNAVDGMRAVSGLTGKRDDGKLSEDQYEILRKLYEDDLLLTGPELDKAVRTRAKEQLKKLKAGEDLP